METSSQSTAQAAAATTPATSTASTPSAVPSTVLAGQPTIQLQLPALLTNQYFPNDMQFYASVPAAHDGSQQYLNPVISYQQWFQQNLIQQQQQQQPQQDGQQSFSLPATSTDGLTFASAYLDPHSQNLDFHSLNSSSNNDGALSLSTLQSFANSLQQVHTSQGQTFMLAPAHAHQVLNGTTYSIASNQNGSHQSDPHHVQSIQISANVQQAAVSGKKKGAKSAKGAAVTQVQVTPDGKDKKPPKVKGTPNAYALFYKETYSQLREGNPEWKACQIMAEAGKIWKSMNGQGQDRYRAQAEELGQAHQALHNTKASQKKQKNQQKRPMTAYQLFIREHFNSRPTELQQLHAKDYLLQLSAEWKNLDLEAKKEYQEKARLEKVRREQEAAALGQAADGQISMSADQNQPAPLTTAFAVSSSS